MVKFSPLVIFLLCFDDSSSFQFSLKDRQVNNNFVGRKSCTPLNAVASDTEIGSEKVLAERKKELLALLGSSGIGESATSKEGAFDPVLCDPVTKEPIRVIARDNGPILFESRKEVTYDLESASNKYSGSSDSFLNLLTPVDDSGSDDENDDSGNTILQQATRQLAPLIPPQLRSVLAVTGIDDSYIPMRDLFTSPSVSFAYERGWRQNFAAAGFPGADREFVMASEYFAPALSKSGNVVVDMSCATGLFTRRFAAEDSYDRVLGCDYSDAMLTEARRRIKQESKLSSLKKTQLDLVRLDVGQIPMQDGSVDALHAGAAMHCWPDLDAALSEIYRVLKPGGRYFATTFLSTYFSVINANSGDDTPISQLAFQNFKSADTMKELLVKNGFEAEKTSLEVLGNACLVIRCEK